MPTLSRRNTDAGQGGAPTRSVLADAAWAVEDRVVWGAADLLRALAEAVRWPFERLLWAVENWIVWPIQEETALWGRWARAAALLGTVALAAGAALGGIALSGHSGGEHRVSVAEEAASVSAAPSPVAHREVAPSGQRLYGVAPSFQPQAGEGDSETGSQQEAAAPPVAETDRSTETDQTIASTESSSGGGGAVVAGPAAIKVAREFSQAFVLYETGRTTAAVKAAFHRTTTPELAKALLRRPPRLPAGVKVPKAKVLNIVPGPSQGDAYTVSVSLLRVGVTSELRLEMSADKDGTPQVVDIRG